MKKFITVFLSFVLYFNTFSTAHAAGLGGWSLSNPIAQGASVLYNGARNTIINGANVAKTSTALITPTATQVAKVLARGGAAYALSVAVQELLGAVDWVLDPANNQIVYTDPNKPDPGISDDYDYATTFTGKTLWYSTKKLAVDSAKTWINANVENIDKNKTTCTNPSENVVRCTILRKSDTQPSLYINESLQTRAKTISVEQPERKTIPLPTVANQVISNAESGNAAAQSATTAAAADVVNDAQNDSTKARPIVDQLETNAKTETDANANNATGEAKPNTGTGGTDLSIAFPAFCGWAPLVCEAAQSAISFPKKVQTWWDSALTSITQAWSEATEYFRRERDSSNDSLDIPVPTNPPIDSSINFGGSCPADKTANINMGVGTIKMDFTYTHICTVASDIRGIVIFCGFFIGALIIGGIKQ